MATAQDIINRSARRIGMLANEEAMTSAEMVNALQAFNDLLHGFGPMGIKYAHTTLAAADTVNFPDEQLRNVMILYCKDLADEFSIPISQSLAADINRAQSELQAAYLVINPAVPDRALRSRRPAWFDFVRGQ
jgi:hypothetical protein